MSNNNTTLADRMTAVMYNSAGIVPVGSIVRITSGDIEEFILQQFESVFKKAGKSMEDVDLAVKIRWNSEFNSAMRRDEKNVNVSPFTVAVGYCPESSKKRDNSAVRKHIAVGSQNTRTQIIDLMYNADEKLQVAVTEDDVVNRCVSLFVPKKVKWKINSKKNNIVATVLDTRMIIDQFFMQGSAESAKFNWDITVMDASGPNTMKDRRRSSRFKGDSWTDQFVMLVAKKLQNQKFKGSKRRKDIKKFL